MVRRTTEKIISLFITITAISVYCFCNVDFSLVGVSPHSTLLTRFIYSFFHANIFHLSSNLWCFLLIIFSYNISWQRLLFSVLAAVTVPNWVLTATPTIGLSAICYTLLGSITFEVQRKLYFTMWITFFIAIGFLFPNSNAYMHLYAYVTGLIYSLIFTPIICKKK